MYVSIAWILILIVLAARYISANKSEPGKVVWDWKTRFNLTRELFTTETNAMHQVLNLYRRKKFLLHTLNKTLHSINPHSTRIVSERVLIKFLNIHDIFEIDAFKKPTTLKTFDNWVTIHSTWDPRNNKQLPHINNLDDIYFQLLSFTGDGILKKQQARKNGVSKKSESIPRTQTNSFNSIQYSNANINLDSHSPDQVLLHVNKVNGDIKFYDAVSRHIIWSYNVQSANINSFTFAIDRSPSITVLTSTGDLKYFRFRVYYMRRLIIGIPRKTHTADPHVCQSSLSDSAQSIWPLRLNSAYRLHGISDIGSFKRLTNPPLTGHLHFEFEIALHESLERRKGETFTNVANVKYNRSEVVVVSSNKGRIVFYSTIGGMLGTVVLTTDPITAIDSILSKLVAVSFGNRIVFVDAIEMKTLPFFCEGSMHNITGFSNERAHPHIIYATTTIGRVMVFKLKNLNNLQSTHMESHQPSCILSNQIVNSKTQKFEGNRNKDLSPMKVSSIPGFVCVAQKSNIRVYKLDPQSNYITMVADIWLPIEVYEKYGILQHISTTTTDMEDIVFAIALHTIGENHTDNSTKLHLVDLFLIRPNPNKMSISLTWIRGPMILVCGAGVLLWQWAFNRSYNDLVNPKIETDNTLTQCKTLKSYGRSRYEVESYLKKHLHS